MSNFLLLPLTAELPWKWVLSILETTNMSLHYLFYPPGHFFIVPFFTKETKCPGGKYLRFSVSTKMANLQQYVETALQPPLLLQLLLLLLLFLLLPLSHLCSPAHQSMTALYDHHTHEISIHAFAFTSLSMCYIVTCTYNDKFVFLFSLYLLHCFISSA